MTLNFVIPEFNIGGAGTPPLEFYRRGFNLGGSGSQPSWRDVILHGNTALTLVNSKANGLNYLKLFGGTEQTGTPTPNNPIDIISNNGALKMVDDELPAGYKRVLGYSCNNDSYWVITDFHLMGSDTVHISVSIDAACNVFGCYQGASATDNYDLYASTSSGGKYFRYADGTYLSYWAPENLGKRFDIIFSPKGSKGMPEDSTWTPTEFTSANNLLLGATTLTGTSAKLKGNLYENFEVNSRLKLIPCERETDGNLGYFDTYTEKFFESVGTPVSLGYDYSHYTLIIEGTTETVKISGKNLFDKVSMGTSYGIGLRTDNRLNVAEPGNTGVIIPVLPNTQYTLSTSTSVALFRMATYNKFLTPEDGTVTPNNYKKQTNNTPMTFTTTSADRYLYVQIGSSTFNEAKETLQLEFGATATEYEAYYNGGSATAETLLKVGDYQDLQSVLDGVVTRNVGIKVLDGTEEWESSTTPNIYYVRNGDSSPERMAVLSTHYVGTSELNANMPNNSVKNTVVTTGDTTGAIYIKTSDVANRTAFMEFLANQYAQGTPVILVYPLATAKTETVTAQPLTIQAGTNIVEITQASIDNLELEVSYKAGVEVTVTEIENAQLDNSVEVTVNG